MEQVLIIHGGHSFSSYDRYIEALRADEIDYERLKPQTQWKSWIAGQLPDIDVLLPTFPNKDNAVFDEWTIYFEKLLPFLKDDVQIIGHSLGAMFLAKYLNQRPLNKPVKRLVLIAGGYDDETDGDLGSFKVTSAANLPKSAKEIHLFHSKDDPVVPFTELAKFHSDLPTASIHMLENRGHFNDAAFPELLELLKQK
jgi:predicted alpha/beta hydrolase family esterase